MASDLSPTKKACPPVPSSSPVEPFAACLARQGLTLTRSQAVTLQVNLGLLCNQSCGHCHHQSGPGHRESMEARTMEEIISYARRGHFQVIDLTGGAPEMNVHLPSMIRRLSTRVPRILLRTNLVALGQRGHADLMEICKDHRVVLIASFPALQASALESQRGSGSFLQSITALQKLNAMGYGREGAGLELNLVSNPIDASLPVPQGKLETAFRLALQRDWGITFSHLFCFTNAPLGRFRAWLQEAGLLEDYLQRLAAGFNPSTLEGLGCRSLISVSWEGYLYDCDFNLAAGIPLGMRKIHISQAEGPPEPGSPIAVSDHCYACTAQAGFT